METEDKKILWNEFWKNKEFWKDAALFVAIAVVVYIVYIIIEYWPDIVHGFNKGWNSR